MAISVPPPPRARSMSSDRRTGRKLLTAFVLARMSLLVLTGRASVNAACVGHERHPVENRYKLVRRLDVVLAGSTDAVVGRRCSLVIGQDDDLAAFDAARKAVTDDVDTASPLTGDAPLHQQRTPSLDAFLQAEEGRLRGVRRAGSAAATQTMSSTLVVAGLIGLLGVCGAAASVVHTVTGPVRRAVRVLQAPERGRPGHRLRPTTLRELQDMSRAVDTAGHDPFSAARAIGADARSLSPASEGPTATSGPPSSSAEELATPAGVSSTDAEQEPAEDATKAAAAVAAASPPAAGSGATTRYAAARSRALGPTTALWHAVELDRLAGAIGGACETTVCGSLVRMSTEQSWPVPARDVCPACSTLAH